MDRLTGILELSQRADGRLRQLDKTLIIRPDDPIVPARMIEQFHLRPGLEITVEVGRPNPHKQNYDKHNGRHGHNRDKHQGPQGPRAERLIAINGALPTEYRPLAPIEQQTSIDPAPRLTLEYPGCPAACRLIDLFCPIGYGQRGLIVSPPKAGKTILLQQIANAISKNHPACEVFALLVDERPEEVTDFRRNVPCTVWASSNDHTAQTHVALAITAIERAKRLVEGGKNVVVLLDSLTRVGRAFNTSPGQSNSGRTLSGGLDARALAIPKQLFGAARKTEESGSLTILATCLIDTGSRGDQVIFEEFKGTGNMELILDRSIAERRLFPAINLAASGTRKEHLLLSPQELGLTASLRRRLINMKPPEQVEQLLKVLDAFKTNDDLITRTAAAPAAPTIR